MNDWILPSFMLVTGYGVSVCEHQVVMGHLSAVEQNESQ